MERETLHKVHAAQSILTKPIPQSDLLAQIAHHGTKPIKRLHQIRVILVDRA